MPKFTLNDNEIEFKHGQTIMEAAKDNGISIPHFCWHPKLSISGNCRVCLVEVEKIPKLVIACSTVATEGMVVHSESEKTLEARNAVMEFLLINHPLDCPICDEAGECKLQDYAYKHSTGESRYVEEKTHKDKRVQLGPRVMFDGDRCISCSRCIRFCDEIVGEPELTFVNRGNKVTISTFPGKQLENKYSMNTVDICPVGALTSRDFRFQSRVWDLSSNPSICTGCSRGCNTEVWVRNNEVKRLTPRFNDDVNSFWMCDDGRINSFKHVNAEDRIDGAHIRKDGQLIEVGWDEAFANASSELKNISSKEIAFIGSAYSTCEDNYLLSKFAKDIIGSKNIDFIKHNDPNFGDELLRQNDITPNTMGAELTGISPKQGGLNIDGIVEGIKSGKIKGLFIMEDDLLADYPELEKSIANLELLIILTSNYNKTTAFADFVFPAATFAEKNGTYVNFEGRVQRLKPAVETTDLDRSLDGMAMSRLDKFGTSFDRWAKGNKRDARASWKIISSLSVIFDKKLKFKMAENIFDEMSKTIEAFKGLDYDLVGDKGVSLKDKLNEVTKTV